MSKVTKAQGVCDIISLKFNACCKLKKQNHCKFYDMLCIRLLPDLQEELHLNQLQVPQL
jgi:hypothetical protein